MNWLYSRVCVLSPGSIDGTVRCWDTRSRKNDPIQVLDEARDSISSLKVVKHELLTGSAHHAHMHASCAYHKRIHHNHWCSLDMKVTWPDFTVPLFRSVDGRVRRYDLRMGQLHVDFISSKSSFYTSFQNCYYQQQRFLNSFTVPPNICRRQSAKMFALSGSLGVNLLLSGGNSYHKMDLAKVASGFQL